MMYIKRLLGGLLNIKGSQMKEKQNVIRQAN